MCQSSIHPRNLRTERNPEEPQQLPISSQFASETLQISGKIHWNHLWGLTLVRCFSDGLEEQTVHRGNQDLSIIGSVKQRNKSSPAQIKGEFARKSVNGQSWSHIFLTCMCPPTGNQLHQKNTKNFFFWWITKTTGQKIKTIANNWKINSFHNILLFFGQLMV